MHHNIVSSSNPPLFSNIAHWYDASLTGSLTIDSGVSGSVVGNGVTATFTSLVAHGYVTGQEVQLFDFNSYNGNYTITVTSATKYQFASSSTSSESGKSKLSQTPQVSSLRNLGTAGGALEQSTLASMPQLQSDGSLRFDGSNDCLLRDDISLGTVNQLYFACIFKPLATLTGGAPNTHMAGYGRVGSGSPFGELKLGGFGVSNRVQGRFRWGGASTQGASSQNINAGTINLFEGITAVNTGQFWFNGKDVTYDTTTSLMYAYSHLIDRLVMGARYSLTDYANVDVLGLFLHPGDNAAAQTAVRSRATELGVILV